MHTHKQTSYYTDRNEHAHTDMDIILYRKTQTVTETIQTETDMHTQK